MPWTFVVVSDPAVKERLRQAAEHEEWLLYKKRVRVRPSPGTGKAPLDGVFCCQGVSSLGDGISVGAT